MRNPALAVLLLCCCAALPAQTVSSHSSRAPLHFEPNAGRVMAGADYLAHTAGYQLGLRAQGAELIADTRGSGPVRLEFRGAKGTAAASASERQAGTVSYFFGRDPARWQTGLPMYGRVSYRQIYPGVDIAWYGTDRQIEYDLKLAPGAGPAVIALTLSGADAKLTPAGDLALAGPGAITLRRPVAYQERAGTRAPVTASYVLANNVIRFRLGAYDHSAPLVIDPIVSYDSYLGGSQQDLIGQVLGSAQYTDSSSQGLATDAAHNVYVTGTTYSTDFPVKGTLPGPPVKAGSNGGSYGFVTKFNASGSLGYSAYFGGSYDDTSIAIAVDSAGAAYLTGFTTSTDFPVTSGAFQTICAPFAENATLTDSDCAAGLNVNAFLLKLSASGNTILYGSYLGGSENSYGYAIAVDGSGQAYVAGVFSGDDCYNPMDSAHHQICFPTTPGAVIADNGSDVANGFLSVFNSSGSGLLYSTLVGDPVATHNVCPSSDCQDTASLAVALDPSGNIYVGGWSDSTRLPVTSGAYQKSAGTIITYTTRGWLAKFTPVAKSASLTYLTYLGGTQSDAVGAIAADVSGNAYLTSYTSSPDFPVTAGAYQKTCGAAGSTRCNAAYVAKMNPSGSALVWSTYFGDTNPDNVTDDIRFAGPLVLDASNNIYITGRAGAGLETAHPIAPNVGGNDQAFVAKFSPDGSTLLFATLFGGGTAGAQEGAGLAVDASANLYLAGNTDSADFTASSNAVQSTYAGGAYDGFVAFITQFVPSSTTLSVSPGLTFPVGDTATLKATIGGKAPAHTGTVTFNVLNGTTVVETIATVPVTNGVASVSAPTSGLSAGSYTLDAVYSGDYGNTASTSTSRVVTLTDATTTTSLAVSSASVTPPANETFTATVTGSNNAGAVTGTVSFFSEGQQIGSAAVNNGKAVFTQSSNGVPPNTYPVTATYNGNSYYSRSTSAAVNVTVK